MPGKSSRLAAMSVEEMTGLGLAWLVMFIGLAGAILPGLPSTPIVLLGAIGHKMYFGDQGSSWWMLGFLTLLTVVSLVLDYVASVVGARKLGATKWGVIGAIVGAMVGLFFPPIGLFAGPFVGALALEVVAGRGLRDSTKAGFGAVLGVLAGALGKILFSIVMLGAFTVEILGKQWGN